jgi:acyl-CoA synthetase (AMP-forming)/AMP-acid ligase II
MKHPFDTGGTFSCPLEPQSAHQRGSLPIPKGVMLSHRALWASAAAVNGLVPILTRDSVCLHAAPLSHIAGFSPSMMSFLVNNAPINITADNDHVPSSEG